MTQEDRITLRLVGTPEDDQDVRFGAFVNKLEAMKDALRATDRVISQGEPLFDYRVVNLSHESPAAIEVEAVPLETEVERDAGFLMDTFYQTLEGIQVSGDVPEGFGYTALQKFKGLQPSRHGATEVVFLRGEDELSLSGSWSKNVDQILGPDQFELGSATGMLQQLNVHGGKREFTIYPTFGEPPLQCRFDAQLRGEVVKAVDCYVEVYGRLRYKVGGMYPHAIDAEDIEPYAPESQLPTLDELFGAAPDATEGKSIEEFVQDIRRGW